MASSAAAPVLALDLGASRIRAAVVDADGRILARRDGRTPGADGPAAVVAACIDHLRGVREEVDPDIANSLRGVGLSAPGPVDPRAGTLVEPPNIGPGFQDVQFSAPIGDALGLAAVLERDTHVAALGELTFGAARGCRDFLYLTVSTGFGGAIVIDGRLYGGPDGVAGELGHLVVDLDGPPLRLRRPRPHRGDLLGERHRQAGHRWPCGPAARSALADRLRRPAPAAP